MKLQSFSVVFVLIVIPLILVLTYYIQLQINTITLQNEYDSYLLGATYDAMSSFEINTANEDLSSVSDSLRTIIEASSNVFINTLSTNLGMSNASKSYVEPNIPALLYTLYDGYYIYAPTKVPTVLTDSDGNAISVGDEGVTTSSGGADYKYNEGDTTQLKYSDISPNGSTDYGQLLYLKKGSNDLYTTNIADAKLKTKNILKTYMPYSARYQANLNGKPVDISVVYTLDNYVTIEGSIGDEYYTKSGYLIPQDSVSIEINGDNDFLLNYNQNDAQKIIEESGSAIKVSFADPEKASFTAGINSDGRQVKTSEYENDISALNNQIKNLQEAFVVLKSFDTSKTDEYNNAVASAIELVQNAQDVINSIHNSTKNYNYSTDGSVILTTLSQVMKDCTSEINVRQYELDKISAAVYYTKAKIFSEWVYTYLKDLKEKDLVEISGQSYTSINGTESVIYDFSKSERNVFDVNGTESNGQTEIDIDSPFYTHKMYVIRNSIQYNLNLTMSTYNDNEIYTFDYEMPVISNEEWNEILTKVSVVSFMQGIPCGLKTYNNYKIVSSTNNEILISPNDIYYVEKSKFNDENSEYHKINCKKLIDQDVTGNEYIAFTSKEVKYDKISDNTSKNGLYYYDHKNLACYRCVNDRNYSEANIFDQNDPNYSRYENLRKAFYIGIGKERNNIYKMNAIENSEGFEIIYNSDTNNGNFKGPGTTSTLNLGDIRAIEIVIGKVNATDRNESTLTYSVGLGNVSTTVHLLNDMTYTMASNSTKEYTMLVEVNPNKGDLNYNSKVSLNSLFFNNVSENSSATYDISVPEDQRKTDYKEKNDDIVKRAIKYVRVIYK